MKGTGFKKLLDREHVTDWLGETAQGFGSSILNLRNRHFALIDAALLLLTPVMALTLRVAMPWDPGYLQALVVYTLWSLLIKLLVFQLFHLYSRYWQFASVDEAVSIFMAGMLATLLVTGSFWGLQALGVVDVQGFPRSVPLIDGLLTFMVIGGTRFSVRATALWMARTKQKAARKRVLIAGAGSAGELVARELLNSSYATLQPVGFVDDDPLKIGSVIHGLRILGPLTAIPRVVKDMGVQEVVIAIPTAAGKVIREIVRMCQSVNVPSRTMPGIYEILSGQVGVDTLRKVEIEDLLRREAVQVESEKVGEMVRGKRVLVTGAGGSIGSELCRQMLRFEPAELVLLGHGENSLFTQEIQLLRQREVLGVKEVEVRLVVGDVRDEERMRQVFERFQPQIVFHAAAHKHVPLMEENAEEAVTNNVWGTWVTAREAYRSGVERFVLISTDKAVNPYNVMGMSKRVAEYVVRYFAQLSGKPFVAVRFGNVLGSRGSVVPVFQEQIAEGGPVTVTHPEVRRYFMTIPEAVQLVLQAAVMGEDGDVFVLDMGEPIKIVDLVQDMIELSGRQVGLDVEIVFTGLRAGEKLTEELFSQDEEPHRTEHEKIFVARGRGWNGTEGLEGKVLELVELARAGKTEDMKRRLEEAALNPERFR